MKAWALVAAAAVLLLAGSARAQDCTTTVVGCETCDDVDPSQCLQCGAGFIDVADFENNKCDCLEGLELVGTECRPITPASPPPPPPVKPVGPYRPNPAKLSCLRRFPGCKLCDKRLTRCVECVRPFKLHYGKCRRQPECRKGYRLVKGRCVRAYKW